MIRKRLLAAGIAALALAWVATRAAADEDWPREIALEGGTVTLYQPQIEVLEANRVEARTAISWVAAAGGAPVFGAVWITARLETDRDQRLVTLADVKVPQVRIPEGEEGDSEKLAALLEREIPRWELEFSLDDLLTALDAAEVAETGGLSNEAPQILFSQVPAVLVRIDGEPRFEKLEGSGFERVVNTPFLIVREGSQGPLYLAAGAELWYQADDVLGPWQPTSSVPAAIAGLIEFDEEEGDEAEGAGDEAGEGAEESEPADAAPPKIRVATEPAELIVFDGEPTWKPVAGTEDLLYVDNTDADGFLELSTQSYYVLLSGRWYRSRAVDDDLEWTWVPNDELPEAFSHIAEDGVNGEVLPHVAGTAEAREAVLDNSIPQTAAIKREAADVEVSFDGQPEWQPVEESKAASKVEYAVNTTQSVFKVGKRYFLCEQGVWYESAAATGPWQVAAEVPAAIYSIPPSNPHHNVTYVKVYDVTPEVVYVGYTPGYVHSYVSHGCVVYGTGWRYHPWYGPHYYPRPWTWGVNVRYNPWYGWGFGITYSTGPFRFTFGWSSGRYRPPYYHGWWGPWGYRHYPRPALYHGYRKHYRPRPTPYRPGGARPPGVRPPGVRPRPAQLARPNLYDRAGNRDRMAPRPAPTDRRRPAAIEQRPNDVLTDRAGNVYRKGEDGWQQNENGRWRDAKDLDRPRPSQPSARPSPSRPSARPSPRPSPSRPSQPSARPSPRPSQPSIRPSQPRAPRPQLERDLRSRQRSQQRSLSYKSRPSPRGRGGRP